MLCCRLHPRYLHQVARYGYTQEQTKELEETINATPCELVIVATPIDLRRVVSIDKPCQRVRYELQEIGQPTLADVLKETFALAPSSLADTDRPE